MIFGREMADKVLAGEKTETRRRARGDEPCRYVPGRDYAVQRGRNLPSEGRVRISYVRRESLGEIDDAAARREGFADRAAFLRYWAELHGHANLCERVWVIAFRLAKPRPPKKGGVRLQALGAGCL